jgi:hypothetical protein
MRGADGQVLHCRPAFAQTRLGECLQVMFRPGKCQHTLLSISKLPRASNTTAATREPCCHFQPLRNRMSGHHYRQGHPPEQ